MSLKLFYFDHMILFWLLCLQMLL